MKVDRSVLIVDDKTVNINALTEILRGKYKIMAALGGENAIRLLEKKRPDLVLLDVYMPDIDGFAVLRYMKEREDLATIPVIFVTGEQDAVTEEQGLALGAVDYIKKPYRPSIIEVKVRNHLELKTYRDNLEDMVSERTRRIEEYTERLEHLTERLTESRDAVIMGMSFMSESHDSITGEHIERIKTYTRIISDKMMELYPGDLSSELASLIVLYAPLHDVGKVGVSDTILQKVGTLTSDEFETMKRHTLVGAELLRKIERFMTDKKDLDNLEVAVEIAECHHERFDGSGYPHRMKGDDIPLSARIVTLADIYDALRSSRPYKKAFSHKEAMHIILMGDGRTDPAHFDPKVLETFNTVQGELEKAYQMNLKTGINP